MLTLFSFQQGLFIDPFFSTFQRKEKHERKLFIDLHSMTIRTKVTTTINSKNVDREDFKSGQKVNKHLSSVCLVVNSSSDIFFLIKTKKNQIKRYKGSKYNCRAGIRKSE